MLAPKFTPSPLSNRWCSGNAVTTAWLGSWRGSSGSMVASCACCRLPYLAARRCCWGTLACLLVLVQLAVKAPYGASANGNFDVQRRQLEAKAAVAGTIRKGDAAASTATAASTPGDGGQPALTAPASQARQAKRCVFILGTGRSGSSSLLDAVNQVQGLMRRVSAGPWHPTTCNGNLSHVHRMTRKAATG